MSVSSVSEFEFRVAQPAPRALLDHLSLKEEGLVPNGTVHAKMISFTWTILPQPNLTLLLYYLIL